MKASLHFPTLFKRIFLCLFLPCMLLILIMVGVSIGVTTSTTAKTYGSLVSQRAKSFSNELDIYLSSVDASLYRLSHDSKVVSELLDGGGVSLGATLNTTCEYSFPISGITLYAPDGRTYTSSGLGGVPSLESLKLALSEFFDSDEPSGLFMRFSELAVTYNNVYYPPENGVITYLRRIKGEQGDVGYIVADILPSDLYASFLDGMIEGGKAYITSGDKYLADDGNAAGRKAAEKSYITRKSDCAVGDFGDELSVLLIAPKKPYRLRAMWISLIFVATALALTAALVAVSYKTAKHVTKRLDALYDRMENQQLAPEAAKKQNSSAKEE